ncbi:MAG: P-type conjugative transfer protein TrbL, partial [Zavarzinia sp.]|nr:P-type conjugative transfer protein TrbL [Zavarzinia sp.]
MGSDFSIISDFYNAFIGVINGGFVSIQPDVNYLMSAMIVITIIMAAITTFVWGDVETVTKGLFLKIPLIGFFSYLVENWETVTGTIVSSFDTIGLKGGGATLTAHQFESQPEAVMAIGLNLFTGCLDVISPYMNYWDFFTYFITILVYVVAGLVVIVAFAVITVQIFITFIEFKLIALAAWILIPFGIWTRTNFLSERALGYTFSVGIKMLVLALIVSIGQALFSDITLSEEPNINNALSVAIAAILLMATAIFAPSYAGALIGGGPQTGLGTLAA